MPDDFNLEGDNLEPEASLDDFFQPSAEPTKPGKPEPKKAAKPAASDVRLPVDKSKPLFEKEPGAPPTLEVSDAEAETPAKEKSGGGLLSNKILLIGIAVLAVLMLSVGAYYGYTKFFSKEEGTVAPPPKAKPQAQAQAPAPQTTAPAEPAAETKSQAPAPAKPETPAAPATKGQPKPEGKAAAPSEKKAAEKAKTPEKAAPAPEKAAPEVKGKPAPRPAAPGKEAAVKQQEIKKAPTAPGAKPAPAPSPNPKAAPAPAAKAAPTHAPTAKTPPAPAAKAAPKVAPVPKVAMVSTGPYTIQIGSYAFEESKAAPEAKLKDLGLTDYHYVDQAQRVHLYDVVAGKGLDKSQADSLVKSLAGLKFVPRLEPAGNRYTVIAYSYGKRADADHAKAKIEKAGLGKVSISSYSKTMTLHQLRVGGFPSSAAARPTMAALRKAGFHPVIARER